MPVACARVVFWLWCCFGVAALLALPSRLAAQAGPADRVPAYDREAEAHAWNQEFDRPGLVRYRRAQNLAHQSGNDTIAAKYVYYQGICYQRLLRLDSAAAYFRLGWRLNQRLGRLKGVLRNGTYLVDVYQAQGHPDSAAAVRRRLYALYPQTKANSEARALLDASMADHFQSQGQYERSLRHQLAILAYRQQQHDTANIGVTLVNVGELFYLQQKLRPALAYRQAGLRWLKLDPSMAGTLPEVYAFIGKTYRDLGRLDSAEMAYRTALHLAGPNPEPDATAYLYGELGAVLGQQGRTAVARTYAHRAVASAARTLDLDAQARANYFAGQLELQARQYPAALAYLRTAHRLALRLQNNDRMEPILRELARAEAATGHYQTAYQLREQAAALLDSAHNVAGQQAMAEMEARYQNRDKQHQIQLLHQQNQLRAAEAAAQRRSKYLALSGVAGLLLVVGLVGYLLRQRLRQNAQLASLNSQLQSSNGQLAEANRAKAQLFSIISHDLRAPIANLFQLLTLAEEAPDLLDEATRLQQTQHLRQTSRDLLDTLEDLLGWSKEQLDGLQPALETVTLAPALTELLGLYQPLARRKNVQLSLSCPPDLRLHTDLNFLRVIVRNLLQNAIKFTPAGGAVALVVEAGTQSVSLRVRDSGPGLSPVQIDGLLSAEGPAPAAPGHGLGLRLSREFAAKLGGELRIASALGAGSEFTVLLPA